MNVVAATIPAESNTQVARLSRAGAKENSFVPTAHDEIAAGILITAGVDCDSVEATYKPGIGNFITALKADNRFPVRSVHHSPPFARSM
jgi:hypothetical protein